MTYPKTIKTVYAFLLICILPYCAYAQETEKDNKREWLKKEWINVDWMGNVFKKDTLKEERQMKFFTKIDEWKMPQLDIFKWNKKEDKHKNQYSVGTNLLNWVYFGTSNLELNASISNHFSVFAGAKYNFLKFHTKGDIVIDVFNNHTTAYAGIKWWPWFVNTGWWVGIKGQYSDFSTSGIVSSYLREGVAVGGGLSGGYSFMLGRHFNLDLGVGVWGGTYLEYIDLEYIDLANKSKEAEKPNSFFKIDNIAVSFIYLF